MTRTLLWLYTLLMWSYIPGVSYASSIQKAYHSFKRGQWKQAHAALATLPPEQRKATFYWLQGHLFFAQKQYTRAIRAYRQALPQASKQHQAWIYNNIGNVHFQQRQWQAAATFYGRALAANPKYERARYNLELALQKKQPPPPQSSKNQKPPPPPPPQRGRKRKKKPPKLQKRGNRPSKQPLRMPKSSRIKLRPFDRFLPYWRILRHPANQKKTTKP